MEILCRCCKNPSDRRNNLNKNDGDRIFEISGIKVFKNKRYPKNICSSCIFDLNNAWLFKTMILQNHKCFEKDFGLKQNAAEDDSRENDFKDTLQKVFVKDIQTLMAKDSITRGNEHILSLEKEQSNTENKKNVISLQEEQYNIENDEEILSSQQRQNILCRCCQNLSDMSNNHKCFEKDFGLKQNAAEDDSRGNDSKDTIQKVFVKDIQTLMAKDTITKSNENILSLEKEQSSTENKIKVTLLQEEQNSKENDEEILSSHEGQNICRCCQNPSDMSNNLIKKYLKKIFIFSGIKIFTNNSFPKNICTTCIFYLNNAWVFQTKILYAHKCFEKNFGLKQNAKEDDSEESDSWDTDTMQKVFENDEEILSLHEEKSNIESDKDIIFLEKGLSNTENDKEVLSNFTNMKLLKKSNNPEYECSLCKESYTSAKYFYNHLKCHKERINDCMCLCEICGKFYATIYKLKQHKLRVHLGEKKFKCEFCEKAFIDKLHFQIHKRVHTGEKPYECSYCDKSFNKRWNMVQHTRLHTNEKPYKCPHCPLSFRHNVSKRDHIRSKHSLLDLHLFKSK